MVGTAIRKVFNKDLHRDLQSWLSTCLVFQQNLCLRTLSLGAILPGGELRGSPGAWKQRLALLTGFILTTINFLLGTFHLRKALPANSFQPLRWVRFTFCWWHGMHELSYCGEVSPKASAAFGLQLDKQRSSCLRVSSVLMTCDCYSWEICAGMRAPCAYGLTDLVH